MNVLKLLVLSAVCLLISAVVVFAEGQGVAGDQIIDMLNKLLKDNTIVMAIYTAILTLIGIGVRVLLKKIPSAVQGIVGKIVWKILAMLFGDGVVLEKNTDPEYVKQQLIKKYPLLKIDVKGLANK